MKLALVGVAYGLILLVLSVMIGGAGHGILIPLIISAAPIPVGGVVPVFGLESVTFLIAPFFWFIVAALTRALRRWIFPVVIGLHYASAAIYSAMAWHNDFSDPYRDFSQRIRFAALYLAAFVSIYIGGQYWLWRSFAKHAVRLSHFGEPITAR